MIDNPEASKLWNFSLAELTAGLRGLTRDATLQIKSIEEASLVDHSSTQGHVRRLQVTCRTAQGSRNFDVVMKEFRGINRIGTVGSGLREAMVYRTLVELIPLRMPALMAASASGKWLALEYIPAGKPAEKWGISDYQAAIDNLAQLHDRFWTLGEDLANFVWLARPLDSDFEILVKTAAIGVQKLVETIPINDLNSDVDLMHKLGRLVLHADKVAANLQTCPGTLLHGDYWPGNIFMLKNGQVIVYDWQYAAIGPGILDLCHFIQTSLWKLEDLPLQPSSLINRYRESVARFNGYTWTDETWNKLWDYAILWSFLTEWIDWLARIPKPILETRFSLLEQIWLKPFRAAVAARLPEVT